MANKYNWRICRRCHLPFIPYLGEKQTICSWICEKLEREEMMGSVNARTVKTCAACGKPITKGQPYFTVGDKFLRMRYFGTDVDNVFCSKDCVCDYLSVIEVRCDCEPIKENVEVPPERNTNLLRVLARVCPEDAEVNGEREPDVKEPLEAKPRMPGLRQHKKHFGWIWDVTIDIANGKILNWPEGVTAKTWYKTSDQCGLSYLGKKYKNYSPDFLGIWDKGWGDYIYLEILGDGTIKDWNVETCKTWLRENIDKFDDLD